MLICVFCEGETSCTAGGNGTLRCVVDGAPGVVVTVGLAAVGNETGNGVLVGVLVANTMTVGIGVLVGGGTVGVTGSHATIANSKIQVRNKK